MKQPDLFTCDSCEKEDLKADDIDQWTIVLNSPGDVGASSESTQLCEKCSTEFAEKKNKLTDAFGFSTKNF